MGVPAPVHKESNNNSPNKGLFSGGEKKKPFSFIKISSAAQSLKYFIAQSHHENQFPMDMHTHHKNYTLTGPKKKSLHAALVNTSYTRPRNMHCTVTIFPMSIYGEAKG